MIGVLLLGLLPALGPDTAAALARAVTVTAADDSRLEVVSAFDLREQSDAERCEDDGSSAAEACVARLAAAYDARLVFFVRVYEVSGETHVALLLRDLSGKDLSRDIFTGADDKALFQATQERTKRALARTTIELSATERTRLFVVEPAVQSRALQKSALQERIEVLDGEIAIHAMWGWAASGLMISAMMPAVAAYYAERLGLIEREIALVAIVPLIGAIVPVYLFLPPAAEGWLQVQNRRDGMVAELASLEAEVE